MQTVVTNYPAMNVPHSVFVVDVIQGANTPPSFATEVSLYHIIVKANTSTPWSYKLPAVIDVDADDVTVSIG